MLKCSTPVGVKDRFTRLPDRLPSRVGWCSTPVGVKDRFTRGPPFAKTPQTSAQRLSASKIGSRNPSPFGVGDGVCAQRLSASKIGSRATGQERRSEFECSTPVGVKDRFTKSRILVTSLRMCAQRLSASKIGSPLDGPSRRTGSTVLNACRRQRSVHNENAADVLKRDGCSTPVGVKDRFTMYP